MRLALPLVAFALLVLAAYTPSTGLAPTAEVHADTTHWKNLHVLSDTLSVDGLMAVMRGFTDALGVQCNHCHVRGEDEMDFASDDNPHKDVARGMMRMTWQINTEILPGIEGLGHHGPPQVTCATCHRGMPNPNMPMDHEAEEAGDAAPEHEHGEGENHDHDHGDGH